MSGPARDEQLYESYSGSLDWDRQKVTQLRTLADRVENGLPVGDDSAVENQQIANLLRAKADKIEAAIRTMEQETSDSYNELVKAIQYNYAGDWGADRVKEAWNDYADKGAADE